MPSYEIPTLSESTQFFSQACECEVRYHTLPRIHETDLSVLSCLHLGEVNTDNPEHAKHTLTFVPIL
jgi:hypothetical protein